MEKNIVILSGLLLVVTSFVGCAPEASMEVPNPDHLIFANAEIMVDSYKKILDQDLATLNKLQILIQEADQALEQTPVSVMDKGQAPPSGDKHDYMSQGPYWWPDPDQPDGLPYIRRDGEVNPEKATLPDHDNFNIIMRVSDILGKAYFFTQDEKYARKLTQYLRVWFLDEATQMNPHLKFGQAIPGRTVGRGIGIIESRRIGNILDAIVLIRPSEAWSEADENGMQAWCREYLYWLRTSKHGQDESIHPNNHGTWYDVQTSALAVFTGQMEVARELCEKAKTERLDAHIQADGTQPRELARTRSWNYSVMNLWGLFQLARLGEHAGVDLWNYPSEEETMLRDALDYLVPFALGESEWPHAQITEFKPESLIPHLQVASTCFS